jgi:signal transduction histidine kinase
MLSPSGLRQRNTRDVQRKADMSFLQSLFNSADLAPHGYCLFWRPELLLLQVVPDAFIALSYYSISLGLALFVRRRSDLAFRWIFRLFGIFIFACGTTHWLEIWTLWHPDYALQGVVKAGTAAISLVTAVLLWPLLPRALALPSPEMLRKVNEELTKQIHERDEAVDALEREVRERLRTEDMLRQSQKMEAIGQLTGGIAHDFNNLLTVIAGNIELMEQRIGSLYAADSALARLAGAARRGADRATRLVQQLLAFSRQQTLCPKSADLNEVVIGAAELWRNPLGKDVEVETRTSLGLWKTRVDPNQMENVLLNLIVNARDALPGGGRITIETANAVIEKPRSTAYDAIDPGEYVVLTVRDNGVGMSREIIGKAIEPFFTTKEIGRGSGLGLSMIFGFVRQSGGFLDIVSEPGRGTSVALYLPRHGMSADRPDVEIAVAPSLGCR